ncbi:MAG: aminotransferase class I/II-fold pyridoxal phosphate-dependent enzyme [Vulcanimicrobiaceae bacterium]
MPVQYHISGATANAIAESVERAIDGGRFAAEEPLPTIRALAADLGVSPTTVSSAFALLRRRGRIVGRRRGGSIVVRKAAFQSGSDTAALPRAGRNLAVANPDPAFLPAMKAALTRTLVERRLYTDIADSPALRSVARRAFARDGVAAEHVGIASGAMDAIERALVESLAPGDTLALEDPTYPPYVELARVLGLQVARVAVDARGILPSSLRDAVRAGAKALVVVPRAHNPTGASFDAARVRDLEAILAPAPDLMVIEDDFLANVCGVALATLTRARARFVHVRSLAKSLGPDLRVAPFAGDALTVARMRARQHIGCGWVSLVLQDAAAVLLRDAPTLQRLRAATRAYADRRATFVAALASVGLTGTPGCGFTVWVAVRDEAAAVGAAHVAGFAIDGGARYREHAPPGVRVTTTTLRERDARTLAVALASAGRRATAHP